MDDEKFSQFQRIRSDIENTFESFGFTDEERENFMEMLEEDITVHTGNTKKKINKVM